MGRAQGPGIMAIEQTMQRNVDPPSLKLAARRRPGQDMKCTSDRGSDGDQTNQQPMTYQICAIFEYIRTWTLAQDAGPGLLAFEFTLTRAGLEDDGAGPLGSCSRWLHANCVMDDQNSDWTTLARRGPGLPSSSTHTLPGLKTTGRDLLAPVFVLL